jgi:hypothetical protein
MQPTRLALSALLLAFAVSADDHSVDFDPGADFSQIKTFALGRQRTINSNKPELNDELVKKKLDLAVRTELTKKGLLEVPAQDCDMVVRYHLGSVNKTETTVWIGRWGGTHRATEHFTEGTLILNLVRRDTKELLWRGVYRDDEKRPAKLSEHLPRNVARLFEKYPPGKK